MPHDDMNDRLDDAETFDDANEVNTLDEIDRDEVLQKQRERTHNSRLRELVQQFGSFRTPFEDRYSYN